MHAGVLTDLGGEVTF